MASMTTRKDFVHFLNDPVNAQELNSLVEDIRCAFMDYQVRALKRLTLALIADTYHRLRYNETSTTRAAKRS